MFKPAEHWKKLPDLIWPPGSQHKAGLAFEHKLMPLTVIFSVAEMDNGEKWFHLSLARPDRLPSWDEVAKVKMEFLGPNTEAFHIIPKREDYVNLHRYCIHIWSGIKAKQELPNLQKIKVEVAV